MRDTLIALATGFGTGLSLIVAIGAQNAFVLRQGLLRRHVPAVVTVCAGSDVVLIFLGIMGIGALLRAWPPTITVVGWAGAAFLIGYGALAALRAMRPTRLVDDARPGSAGSLRTSVFTCLALTWLNPHVYLDTVLLLGSVANGLGHLRWIFGAGAGLASAAWFAALGFGARRLRPLFARPGSWRALDGLIAVTMVTLGVTMVTGLPHPIGIP